MLCKPLASSWFGLLSRHGYSPAFTICSCLKKRPFMQRGSYCKKKTAFLQQYGVSIWWHFVGQNIGSNKNGAACKTFAKRAALLAGFCRPGIHPAKHCPHGKTAFPHPLLAIKNHRCYLYFLPYPRRPLVWLLRFLGSLLCPMPARGFPPLYTMGQTPVPQQPAAPIPPRAPHARTLFFLAVYLVCHELALSLFIFYTFFLLLPSLAYSSSSFSSFLPFSLVSLQEVGLDRQTRHHMGSRRRGKRKRRKAFSSHWDFPPLLWLFKNMT